MKNFITVVTMFLFINLGLSQPNCTNLTNPTNGSTDVNITTDLSWSAVEGADGYKLTVGTTSGGTDIMDNEDVGNVTTFDPGDFPCGSDIYVTIVPYNGAGDATGCTEESFTTEDVTADAGTDTEFCAGGSVQLNASGGTTYSWSPTDSLNDPNIANPVASPAATTTYTVTVSNDGRCPDTADVLVTVNPNPVPNATATDETANDANDGTATSNPTSGTSDYSYNWSNGETTQTITDLAPGDYIITVTDSKSCTGVDTTTVNEYVCPTINPNATATDETGNDFNDGTATSTPSGGTSPYTYEWSNNATTQTITDLSPGDYIVTVTDNKNCTGVDIATVNEYVCPTITLSESIINTSCNEDCDGSITVTPSGGTAPYTYSWSNEQTTQTATGLCAGEYTVTVTDSKNCSVVSGSYTVSEPDDLLANASATDETGNDFEDGTATSAPTGGTAPYTYAWSNGEITQTITGLAPGNYTVTVTDSKSCTGEETVTVAEYICPTITLSESITNASCNGNCDGSITVTPSGGTAPYTYFWSNGQTTPIATGLCAGEYTVTVTDSKNCSVVSGSYTVSEPDVLLANASATDETANGANDGTATANPTGGTTPYTYAWSNGDTTQTITGLAPGDYTVTVTDVHSCTAEKTVTVNEYGCPDITLTTSYTPAKCNGSCDGTATVTPSGGTTPYSYEWSNGQTTQTTTGLCAGTYTVTVTDSANCVNNASVTVTEPDQLTVSAEAGYPKTVSCNDGNDGAIHISTTGGTSPYTYDWADIPGNNNPEDRNNLSAGTYTFTVTDANNCTATKSWEVTEPDELIANANTDDNTICIGESSKIEASYTGGNQGLHTYYWSNGAYTKSQIVSPVTTTIYIVTITDSKGCSDTDSVTIAVNPLPDVSILGLDNVCENSKIDLEGKPEDKGTTVSWKSNDPTIATVNDEGVVLGKSSGSAMISYTYTNPNNGCKNTSTKNININPLPVVSISGEDEVCEKSTIKLYGNPNINGIGTWKSNDPSIVSVDNDGMVTGKKNGKSSIFYTFINNNGCTDSTSISMTVHPKPEADYVVTKQGNNQILQNPVLQTGKYYIFKNNSKFNNVKSYFWSFESDPSDYADPLHTSSNDSLVQNVFRSDGSVKVVFSIASKYGCTDSTASKEYTVTSDFTVNIIKSGALCEGNIIKFTTDVINKYADIEHWEWNLYKIIDDSTEMQIKHDTSEQFEYTFEENGEYKIHVKVTDENRAYAENSNNFTINELKQNAEIKDTSICAGNDFFDINTLSTGEDKSYIKFKDNNIPELDNNTGILNLTNIKKDTTFHIFYTVKDGACIGKSDEFNLTIKIINPPHINIIDDDAMYCAGDTIKVKTQQGWNWEYVGMDSVDFNLDTIFFKLGDTENQTLIVSKNENDCTSTVDSTLTVNPLPDLPVILNREICKGDEAEIFVNIDSLKIVFDPEQKYIAKDTFYFSPDSNQVYSYKVTNPATTCFVSGTFQIDVIKIEPKIISLDSCGDKPGSIFTILKESISDNPDSIKWTVNDKLATIKTGQNSRAIILEYADSIKTNILKVDVVQGGCGGNGTYKLSNTNQSSILQQGADSLIFQSCGAIVYNKNSICDGDTYYVGYVDHETGEYERDTTSLPYYIDQTRNENSKRSYFINCSDCSSTNIITYREVEEAIDEGCDDSKDNMKIYIAPNPAMGQFNIYFEGKYRGQIDYELYNTFGRKVRKMRFVKQAYSENISMDADLKSGVYYLKIFDKTNIIKSIPVIILK